MGKKKLSPTFTISDTEILAMYEDVLPLVYCNPKGLDIPAQMFGFLNKAFVPCGFWYHFIQDSTDLEKGLRIRRMKEIHYGALEKKSIEVYAAPDQKDSFEELFEQAFEQAKAHYHKNHPKHQEYDHYWIDSQESPRIGVGFGRYKDNGNAFTPYEIRKFQQLTPHILLLLRAILSMKSNDYEYFRTITQLGSHVARKFDLSESEVRLLPDIVFGHTNEEIADRHFISPATVKTHINHIFKKTRAKNRVDFISKFFTSPDQVELKA